jgi:hypothetical protein
MNSEYIIKLLNRMLNDRSLSARHREIVTQTVQHIKLQGEELQKYKDDITDMKIPRENQS